MKAEWIVRQRGRELLLFFSGWGMDRRLAEGLASSLPPGRPFDVLACHDYRTELFDPETFAAIATYERLTVVAWSFGVWAAVHARLPLVVAHAVALNGTLRPVDRHAGIDPEVFQTTLETYSDENRERFNRRMCGPDALGHFLAIAPLRSTASQKEELLLFSEKLRTPEVAHHFRYDHVIVGGRDRIFPASRQLAAWEGYDRTVVADMPHYPFFHLDGFQGVLACSRG